MRFARSLLLLAIARSLQAQLLWASGDVDDEEDRFRPDGVPVDDPLDQPSPLAPSVSSPPPPPDLDTSPVDIVDFNYQSRHFSLSISPQSEFYANRCGDLNVIFHTPNGSVWVAPGTTADLQLAGIDALRNPDPSKLSSVRVEVETYCNWEAQPSSSDPVITTEFISIQTIPIDPQSLPDEPASGFTIHWDPSEFAAAVFEHPRSFHRLNDPYIADALVLVRNSHEQESDQRSRHIGRLLRQVQQDERYLEDLVYRIAQTRTLLDGLLSPEGDEIDEDQSFSACSGFKCYFRTAVSKGKECIHQAYLAITAMVSSKSDPCSQLATASPAVRVKVLTDPANSCYDEKKYPHVTEYVPLLDDDASSTGSTPAAYVPSPAFSPPPDDDSGSRGRGIALAILGSVASLLCFGCCGALLYSRRNPRARADRAAWLEERRVQREYRRLARRAAMRDWWARLGTGLGACMCCGDRTQPSATDYEEKRVLILRQQQRLEDAAQEEIQYIIHSHHLNQDPTVAAEEGRSTVIPLPRHLRPPTRRPSVRGPRSTRASTTGSDDSNPESLPSYRSRETRPPVYRERDTSLEAQTIATIDFDPSSAQISDGFHNYRPNDAATPSETLSVRASSDMTPDLTPDSSVIALSPRGSSDTLRTELSILG